MAWSKMNSLFSNYYLIVLDKQKNPEESKLVYTENSNVVLIKRTVKFL